MHWGHPSLMESEDSRDHGGGHMVTIIGCLGPYQYDHFIDCNELPGITTLQP